MIATLLNGLVMIQKLALVEGAALGRKRSGISAQLNRRSTVTSFTARAVRDICESVKAANEICGEIVRFLKADRQP